MSKFHWEGKRQKTKERDRKWDNAGHWRVSDIIRKTKKKEEGKIIISLDVVKARLLARGK